MFIDRQLQKQGALEQYDYKRDPNLFKNPDRQWFYTGFQQPTVLKPGEFAVAERDENGNRLFVRVADPAAFAKARIEVPQRRQLLILGI